MGYIIICTLYICNITYINACTCSFIAEKETDGLLSGHIQAVYFALCVQANYFVYYSLSIMGFLETGGGCCVRVDTAGTS